MQEIPLTADALAVLLKYEDKYTLYRDEFVLKHVQTDPMSSAVVFLSFECKKNNSNCMYLISQRISF